MREKTKMTKKDIVKMLQESNAQKIWIVFSGETEIHWLKWFLRKGYRHCYAILNDGEKWMTFDPLAHKTEVGIHHRVPSEFDLPKWLSERGLKVVSVGVPTFKKKSMPPAFFTCVEAVKRLVGVRKMHIFTPYQLFRFLEKNHA